MARKSDTAPELKLLVVESPAKIKTISKFLGKDFVIAATFGHVKDLPENKLGIDLDEKKKSISFEYVVIKDKEKVINEICKKAQKCSEIYLASDPDREGEIISWHIGQEIERVMKDKATIHRIVFNEITKKAVEKAIENKSIVDIDKVAAQQSRRALDRWVGYEVSPILWKKIGKGLSAGRVQSVALLLVCNREEEIQSFKPVESWSIQALLGAGSDEVEAEAFKQNGKALSIKNKEQADKILADLKKASYVVDDIIEKERLKNPAAPFMTSTLQQDAYNKLGFPVERTMQTAQKLYEGIPLSDKSTPEALITYMRTDSTRIADSAIDDVRSFISKEFGEKYLPKKAQVYEKKSGQDAHEAIRPIDVSLHPSFVAKYATPEQAKLYDLIWKRFVACQMAQALFFQRTVHIKADSYLLKLTGSTLMFDGFLKVYLVEEDDADKSKIIPRSIVKGLALDLKNVAGKQHFTQPPARYTEATLIKELEKKGIGRPSTYVAIMLTIQKRKYVTREKKRFIPSELGRAVSALLVECFPDIFNVTFTASMEEDLDKIAEGDKTKEELLFSFYKKFSADMEALGEVKRGRASIPANLDCPECETPLSIKFGKTGEFVGCSGYPECKFTSNFKRSEDGLVELVAAAEVVVSDIECPQCGKNLVYKRGRYGEFLACPGYPECKYIYQETLKMPCPKCSKKVTQRSWKKGKFWGCAGYPDCKFAIFGEVEETPCKKCDALYHVVNKQRDGTTKLSCPTQGCKG
ncbi:DNA topoisomerase I [Candidatus Dependentiae bacterium]|nr:MAG: DNA topoisomerase I [Candidatus Dependentiae bacterium]